MRFVAYLSLAAALAIAGCNSKSDVEAKNESVAAVASKIAASDIKPRPGRWESNLKIESLDMPGVPPQARDAMNSAMSAKKAYFTCLTPAQANRPDASFFQKAATGCTYDHFTMAGGKLDAEVTCNRGPGPAKMTMQGSYGEDNYAVRVSSQTNMSAGAQMKMTMAISSRRVGECNGTEDK